MVLRRHVEYVGSMFHDRFVVLYALLVAASETYSAAASYSRDRRQEVLHVRHPVSGVLLSTHLDRWERADLSDREISSLNGATTTGLSEMVGSRYQTVYMWRMIAVLVLKNKADKLRCGLHDLNVEHKHHDQFLAKHHHGADDVAFELHEKLRFEAEVGERVKAKHAERYYSTPTHLHQHRDLLSERIPTLVPTLYQHLLYL